MCSDKSLEVIVTLPPFSRLIVMGSPLGPMPCLAIDSCPGMGMGPWYGFHLVEYLNSNHKVVDYF